MRSNGAPRHATGAMAILVSLGVSFGVCSEAAAHRPIQRDIADLDARIATDPHDLELRLWRADLLRREGAAYEALLDLDVAETVDPTSARVFVLRARISTDLGRLAEAEAGLRTGIALDPGVADAHLALADLLAARGEVAGALTHYDAALALAPSVVGYAGRGRVLEQSGQLEAARATYLAGVNAAGGAVVLRRALIRVALRLADYETAHVQITAAMAQAQRKTTWLLVRARVFAAAGDQEAARRDLRAALVDAERWVDARPSRLAYAWRAEVLEALGRNEAARLDRRRAGMRACLMVAEQSFERTSTGGGLP